MPHAVTSSGQVKNTHTDAHTDTHTHPHTQTNSPTALAFESLKAIRLNLSEHKEKHAFTHCKVYSVRDPLVVWIQLVTSQV